jgi:dephospho-CoA kinase
MATTLRLQRRRADIVLENDGSIEELRQAALALLDRPRERATEDARRDDAPSSSGKA